MVEGAIALNLKLCPRPGAIWVFCCKKKRPQDACFLNLQKVICEIGCSLVDLPLARVGLLAAGTHPETLLPRLH